MIENTDAADLVLTTGELRAIEEGASRIRASGDRIHRNSNGSSTGEERRGPFPK